MPPTPPAIVRRYYPTLSSVVSLDDFPESLGFVKQAIQQLFSKIHYKDLQYKKSPKGDAAFYSLTIVSNKLGIELFGSGISLVLNPDETGTSPDFNISAFPVTVEYQWKILAYLRSFDFSNFSNTPQEFFELGLIILNVSEEQAMAQFINTFTVPIDEFTSPLQQFVNDLKQLNSDPAIQTLNLPISDNTKLSEVAQSINQHTGKYATLYAFGAYLLKNDLNDTKEKLGQYFRKFIPEDIESYIKDMLVPKARATLTVSAAVEFPRNILYPYKLNGAIWEREPDGSGVLSRFYFGKILLYADTQKGIGYNVDLVGNLVPTYSEIGNTGLLIQLEKLKIDISDQSNIPEADADGRPVDFRGVYANALSVTLPAKWFKTGTNTNGSTLRIGGYNLLIGTGGVSGTFALEAVPTQNPNDGQITDFFTSKFSFVYPITGLINNTTTKEEESIVIADQTELLAYLNSLSNKNLYAFKYPLKIIPIGLGQKEFNSQQEFRNYITDIIVQENGTMWMNVGSEQNGFLIGFKSFDITFKQNKVLSSNIKGALEIKKFVYPGTNDRVRIDVAGHLHDDGSFNLTASTTPPYPIELKEVFTYHISSLELGREGEGDFYIGTSGSIEFQGFLKDTLKLKSIDIDRLRIYSDGSIELEGGSIALVEPIVLALGPVEITVTAIGYGSHQKEVNGEIRKFNYFGFDGGISIDPLGIELRGEGVKFYYCTDNLGNKPKPYVHIKTLYLDLTIPASTPSVIFNGWLSIPEPGTSKEYAGGIKLQLPQAKIAGSADMKLMPKYPAFIIDVSIDLPAPITIGPVGIFALRGLLGYRYVAEKEAAGLVSGVNTWYEYYKAPPRGIHVRKFNGPDKTKAAGTPFSIGIGASLGTSADNGTIVNIKAMILLSIPSLFMIDGKAAVLSVRLGLDDDGEPPFFAFIAVGDNSLELGFGADFKMPSKSGKILTLYADIQAAFFFNDSTKWYVNIGTKTNPVTARVLTLITLKSYLMLSAKGIEAGARGEFDFKRSYGPIKVRAWAYIEVGGKISFERPQFGAYMATGVGADIDIKVVSLYAAFDVLFGVEGAKPYKIYGEFRLCVSIKIAWVFKFKFCGDLAIVWEFDQYVDRTPVDPLINAENTLAIPDIVKGVNMLSNETFDLAYLGASIPASPTTAMLEKIIPLDTYIDIKTEKGFLPGAISAIIGGFTNPPERYTDLVPPEKIIRGKEVRQVKHQYSIESLVFKSWNPDPLAPPKWEDYHPYKALYPADASLNNLKIGQFQKTGNQYNTIRLLATTPFSYTEQGEPGWFIPEQNGITAASLFCEGDRLIPECADFLEKPLGTKYYCYNSNQLFYSHEAAFFLLNKLDGDYAQVVHESNVFGFNQSLMFQNRNKLQIRLPEPSVEVILRLTTYSQGVRVKYYASVQDDTALVVTYGHPDASASNQDEPFVQTFTGTQLNSPVIYNHPTWRPITRIEIEPLFPSQQAIDDLIEQIAVMEHQNDLIALGIIEGRPSNTSELEAHLNRLTAIGCATVKPPGTATNPTLPTTPQPCKKDDRYCTLYDAILAIKQKCLVSPSQVNEVQFSAYIRCMSDINSLLKRFYYHTESSAFIRTQSLILQAFIAYPSLATYTDAWESISTILNYTYARGNCHLSEEPVTRCYTLLHSVCWLSLEHYQYNINIPGQAAITADTQATIDGLTQFIQPILRPDTSYVVQFTLKDNVDDGASTAGQYTYTYGFTTGPPIGFFHKHPKATYGDTLLSNGNILEDANGIVRTPGGSIVLPDPLNPLTPHPELYALTSLTRYIDYNRSNPNADGNLLNSKPLFYNDETTQIYLFYSKAYATHFFHNWQAYNGQVAAAGRIKIVIKDPREGSEIINPPRLDYDENDIQYTHIPQTIESWEDDPNPIVPHVFEQFANLINANECLPFGGNAIIPPSQFLSVKLKHLKPLKMYTAIVNNLYDLNKNGVLEPDNQSLLPNQLIEETVEVHRFTFRTSCYANFKEQVNSYRLTDPENTVTRAAIFPLDKGFTPAEITAAFDTIVGNTNTLSASIEVNYQHKYDRIVEGLFGFAPMDKAVSTEFNVVRDTNDFNKIIAVIICNPEPFNNPKIPIDEVQNTIQVLDGSGNEDTSYKKLFSKDYSQVIIMKNGLEITGPLDIRFSYKIWNGSAYIVPAMPEYSSDDIGTIIVSNLDLQNL